MASEEAEAKEQPKKSKSKAPIFIIAFLVILIAGGAAAVFVAKPAFLFGKGEKKGPAEETTQENPASKPMEVGPLMDLDAFMVNLAPGSVRKMLKISVSLELRNESTAEEAKKRMAVIRDRIILLLTTQRDENFDRKEDEIKKELLRRLNVILGEGAVKNVYFTDRIMQ